MGNCQAAEAATVVIQHPGGRVERLYWPTTAEDIMKSNPGYHVAIVTLCIAQQQQQQQQESSSSDSRASGHVRFTRVRLLKPKDMLLIGQVYRLITSQEVNKALRARKHDKIKRTQSEMMRKQQSAAAAARVLVHEHTTEVGQDQRQEKQESTSSSSSSTTAAAAANAARLRQWRPSLQSISESVI